MENSFDIVMELLSEEDNKFFQEKDKEIRKGIAKFKTVSAQVLSMQKKVDAFIKSHPGCDQEGDKYYDEAFEMVKDLELKLDELNNSFIYVFKRPGTSIEKGLNKGRIAGILISFISVIFIPFSKKFFAGILGSGIATSVASGSLSEVARKKMDKKWEEKESEWKEMNPDNVMDKMNEMYGIVDKMRDTFSKKYSPWLNY